MNDNRVMNELRHYRQSFNRRDFFTNVGSGLAAIALTEMLAKDGYAAGADPMAPKKPTAPVRAKNIIWCFMDGAPSSMDTFDYKPLLNKLSWQPVPPSFNLEGKGVDKLALSGQPEGPNEGLFPMIRPF